MFVKIQLYNEYMLINVDTIRSMEVKTVNPPHTGEDLICDIDDRDLFSSWVHYNRPNLARQSDPNHLYLLFLENDESPIYISKSEYESICNNINIINKENNVYDKCVTCDSIEERWYNVRNNIRQDT